MKGIIGFTGKPGAGKSTAARHISEKHGTPWINVGDPIKDMLGAYYRCRGISEVDIARRLNGDLKETPDPMLRGKTPRFAMQTLGKEWRDLITPYLFIDCWKDRVVAAGGTAVADGMRHKDEQTAFKELGGVLVHIIRPDQEDDAAANSHVAERLQLDPDVTIVNDGTTEDLRPKLDQLVTDLSWARP